jgi:hypothetical protein
VGTHQAGGLSRATGCRDTLFRRRTGKRGCHPSPTRLTNEIRLAREIVIERRTGAADPRCNFPISYGYPKLLLLRLRQPPKGHSNSIFPSVTGNFKKLAQPSVVLSAPEVHDVSGAADNEYYEFIRSQPIWGIS